MFVCAYVQVSFCTFWRCLRIIGHHWSLVLSLGLWVPHFLGHSSFCGFSLLLLLRAKRALQLSPGASSSMLIPQVISFGSETLMFCLQPGLPPSSASSCLYHVFHLHRPFSPSASPYQQMVHSSCSAKNLAVILGSCVLHPTSNPLASLLALPSKNLTFHGCFS